MFGFLIDPFTTILGVQQSEYERRIQVLEVELRMEKARANYYKELYEREAKNNQVVEVYYGA